ncbi:ferric citrate ABC transporter ATP-binding protein FecE [Clostridia bacterium]|nr:ferric citrate ABC transporter ATP-binding protein FecE [Clostridia bacterium]
MIELHNLSGGYGHIDIVKNVSFNLPDGKITAIIGANGCGKSTLLKLVCGQLKPSGGEIIVDGKPLSDLSRADVAKSISYLPQSRTTPDISLESFVLHGRFPWLGYPRVYRAEDRTMAESAMEKAGILNKRRALLTSLSGGERQKAYIAMTLAQNTSHVLLDEPTTYLDIAHQLEFIKLTELFKREGKSVAVVLHDINMALKCADIVAVMKEGEILAQDAPERILSTGAIESAFDVKISEGSQIVFFR